MTIFPQLSNKYLLYAVIFTAPTHMLSAEDASTARVQATNAIQNTLNKFCTDCHNEKKHKGDIRLDNFANLTFDQQFELLGHVEEQVYRREMPPEDQDKVKPPTEAERQSFVQLLRQWDEKHQVKSAFSQKLLKYEYANYVDHDKLFSGEYKGEKAFTYDRKWLVSEYIFNDRVNAILRNYKKIKIGGKEYIETGRIAGAGVANPFLLAHDKTGVLYYANQELGSNTFLAMLGNADAIAGEMINSLGKKYSDYLPAAKEMTALSDKNNAILANRKQFLSDYIDDICLDIYKESNESLLPVYTQIDVPGEISEKSENFGKWGWRNSFGNDGSFLSQALRKFETASKSKREMVEKCQRFWFHYGESPDTIERRTTSLYKKMTSILNYRYYQGNEKLIYKPLKDADEMKIITETIKKHRTKGMTYYELIDKCMADWRAEFRKIEKQAQDASGEKAAEVLRELYGHIFRRAPTPDEIKQQSALFNSYLDKMGAREALIKLAQTLILKTEFIYRYEYGAGKQDQYGRKMLSPRDASYALAYALTETSPDDELVKAAEQGRLNTREDYKREVLRMLADRSKITIIDNVVNDIEKCTTTMPVRKMRFFRDFFGYPRLMTIFKDDKRFGGNHSASSKLLMAQTDMLVEYILEQDKSVFEELLTTDKFYVYHNGDNAYTTEKAELVKGIYDYFKKNNWQSFKNYDDVMKHRSFIELTKLELINFDAKDDRSKKSEFGNFTYTMTDLDKRFSHGQKYIIPKLYFGGTNRTGSRRGAELAFRGLDVTDYFAIDHSTWDYPPVQPAKIANRKGMLTHPAWLIAHSQNTQTDPVVRGKWIREKLLAGSVPDVPITVDAQIPEDKTKTLRQRLEGRTQDAYCWKCHSLMNPIGTAFEMYDDFGRYRTSEELEFPEFALNAEDELKVRFLARDQFRIFYKTLPIETTGKLDGTGDKKLDGDVKDAFDLIDRLAKSTRVRQSIIRNAFRFFMGRNELLSDSKTLIDADEAYVKSGGSFDAVIVSLLTSDSFIYRKPVPE